MKQLILMTPMIFLFYCNTLNTSKISISVKNSTTDRIDSVKITSYNFNEVFKEIEPNKIAQKEFVFNYKGNTEGSFLLQAFVKDSIKTAVTFGFFPSSKDVKTKYDIEINRDFSIQEN